MHSQISFRFEKSQLFPKLSRNDLASQSQVHDLPNSLQMIFGIQEAPEKSGSGISGISDRPSTHSVAFQIYVLLRAAAAFRHGGPKRTRQN